MAVSHLKLQVNSHLDENQGAEVLDGRATISVFQFLRFSRFIQPFSLFPGFGAKKEISDLPSFISLKEVSQHGQRWGTRHNPSAPNQSVLHFQTQHSDLTCESLHAYHNSDFRLSSKLATLNGLPPTDPLRQLPSDSLRIFFVQGKQNLARRVVAKWLSARQKLCLSWDNVNQHASSSALLDKHKMLFRQTPGR